MTVTTALASHHQPSRKAASGGCSVVLVVDDDESYRQALASGLAQEGFAVELAGACQPF
ncbi:MAG: hypothetical protein ABSH29_26650 [Acidimicrobiales bacterium]|jgi:ActR/RegA family two-component response regulator